jgi:hypothetical protein
MSAVRYMRDVSGPALKRKPRTGIISGIIDIGIGDSKRAGADVWRSDPFGKYSAG